MRVHIFLPTLVFFLSITTPAISATTDPSTSKIIPRENIYKKIASLKIKEFQKLVSRKLTIKEKFSFLILRHKLKHPSKVKPGTAQMAQIFGIAGLALSIVGLFVPFVILASLALAILAIVFGSGALKQDPSNSKAHAGKLLGWITLGLIALLAVLAVILFASIY